MARKEVITAQLLLDTAFLMTRQDGFFQVTARKVALKAGCSTQPLFRVYKNMDELWDAVYEKAVVYFWDFYEQYPSVSEVPFVNLGMTYITFAKEEKHLFELLFVSEKYRNNAKSMYEILNGTKGNVVREIQLARQDGCTRSEDLFMQMWIFIHGIACMTLTGDYDLSKLQTTELLIQFYQAFL